MAQCCSAAQLVYGGLLQWLEKPPGDNSPENINPDLNRNPKF